jgi:hypothetical protein
VNTAQLTTVTRIALSLWTSARSVERLPKVLTYEPHETALIVYTAPTYRAGDYL